MMATPTAASKAPDLVCPLCGAGLEWSIHGTGEFATGHAVCLFSGRAYLEGKLLAEYEAGRRCEWTGRVGRVWAGPGHSAWTTVVRVLPDRPIGYMQGQGAA